MSPGARTLTLLSAALVAALCSHGQPTPGHGRVKPGPPSPYARPRAQSAGPAMLSPSVASANPAGIVYTCGPQLQALSAGACNALNTTTSGLYANAFANAGASIYVELGNTALGESLWRYIELNYSEFRGALAAAATDSNDTTALADSVPGSNPISGVSVGLQGPLLRALGLSANASTGVQSNGTTPCSLGTTGCYDGTILISNSQPLYFRTGAISPIQYDFFTVVEHETDEILGTSSCAIGCGHSLAFPADFFRYHSNGTRSFAAGGNLSCSSANANNACFSVDGTHMLQQYNNLNNGDDPGDWTTSCVAPKVQDAQICAGVGGVDISPAAEILVLDVIGYAAQGPVSTGSSLSVTSSTPDGTYGTGASISIQVTFGQAVTVTGTPQLALNSGGVANYTSGSGTGTLTFLNVVKAGEVSSSLDYTSTGALTLNGGSIKSGGSAVNLTLPVPGTPGSLSANKNIVIDTDSTTITIRTNPSGLQFTVDKLGLLTAPQSLSLSVGSHAIAVAGVQTLAGVQYTFTGWSDGGAATHNISVGASPATYIATFAALQGIAGGGLSVPTVTSISANGYFSIFGQNFTNGAPVVLSPSDLVNGNLPTNLGVTCVNVGAALAFPTYVAESQINAIAPAIPTGGPQPVSVTVNCGTGKAVTLPAISVPATPASPEFLYWVQYTAGEDPVIAVDAVQGDYIGPPGLIPGVTFRAAHGGDVLTIYGIAFGHTLSGGPVPGQLPPAADSAPKTYSVTIGNQPANVSYVGVTPLSAGLYQVNLTVPSGLASGNYPIILTVNGVPTPPRAFLPVGP